MKELPWLINTVLDPIGIVIGIVVAIPIFWTWWEVTFGRKRRQRHILDQVRREPGARPGILVIDLLDDRDITASVESYRRSNNLLESIPVERVFKLSREKRLTPNDLPDLTGEIRQVAGDVIRAGVDTLHLFYAGPIVPMGLIGAEFANTCRLILYQHSPAGYENWGPLRHDHEYF